jgi:hypothetical protein
VHHLLWVTVGSVFQHRPHARKLRRNTSLAEGRRVTDSDYDDPPPTQLRAPKLGDEYPVRHTRRRSTKRWCGGKVGVEHDLKIRVKREVASQRTQPHKHGRGNYQPHSGIKSCGWSCWAWRLYDDWNYWCGHEWHCTKCHKIFPLEPAECPEYGQHPKPTISAEEAAERYHRVRLAAREARILARKQRAKDQAAARAVARALRRQHR